jgi:hypothetical protein
LVCDSYNNEIPNKFMRIKEIVYNQFCKRGQKLSAGKFKYIRKTCSLALAFNCLLSIIFVAGLLSGYYLDNWKLYQPYVLEGALFWLIIPTALLNLYPSMKMGRVKIGRPLFHHYVYGFAVMALSAIFLVIVTPAYLLASLFTSNITEVPINIGRFFVLGGLTLVLDDFGDISRKAEASLTYLKVKINQQPKLVSNIHYVLGFTSFYIFAAVSIWISQNPQGLTPANLILVGTLFFTSLTAFGSTALKVWYKVKPEKIEH